MRLDYLFYIVAGLNVVMSFIGTNGFSSALGWGCAILYCWGYNQRVDKKFGELIYLKKDVSCTKDDEVKG